MKTRTVNRVCVVTGTRAEYGLLRPVMEAVRIEGLDLRVIATGMHLLPEFGETYHEIERDGFRIDARVDMGLPGDTPSAMAKSIGVGICGMTQALEGIASDAVLVLGDRVEAFAGAVAGAGSNLLVAHLHGGERTRGGLDESMRHAITKLAHLHLAATERSRERILRMGENPDWVHTVGAPGLDPVLNGKPLDRGELERRLGFPLQKPLVLAVQHPVSTDCDQAAFQITETLEALKSLGHQTLWIYPNSDAGGRRMIEVLESHRAEPWLRLFANLDHVIYLGLLRHADVLIGNSSSGIIEAPSFRLPAVNIGSRQDGRERSANVLDAGYDRNEILACVRRALSDPEFRRQVQSCVNPYGDGKTGPRVAGILRREEISPARLQKQITY